MTQSNITPKIKRNTRKKGGLQKDADLREMLKEATEVSAILHCWHFE